MVRDNAILWLDLETTGSSNDAKIIEFGGIITTATIDLTPIGEPFTTLVDPFPVTSFEDEVVNTMHTTSGLADDLIRASKLPSILEAEESIIQWINDTIGKSTNHIPYGGSGVGHFDTKYIRRDWKKLSKRLTYWTYDIGVVRRVLRLIDFSISPDLTTVKSHRALDDVRLHIEEAREYLKILKNWKETCETL